MGLVSGIAENQKLVNETNNDAAAGNAADNVRGDAVHAAVGDGKPAFPSDVERVFGGLVRHAVVALPASWVTHAGLRPNLADKFQPKRLWVGRLGHLTALLRAERLRAATSSGAVRDTLLAHAAARFAAHNAATSGAGPDEAGPGRIRSPRRVVGCRCLTTEDAKKRGLSKCVA